MSSVFFTFSFFSSSLTELFELQDEEDKILEMIQKLPHVTKFAEEREKISNECIELASEFFSPYLVCLLKIGVWYFKQNDID